MKISGYMVNVCSLLFLIFASLCIPNTTYAELSLQLKLSQITTTSVTCSWQPAGKSVKYELSLGTDGGANNLGITTVSQSSHTYQKLAPGTIHYVKVRIVRGDKKENWSPVVEFTTNVPSLTSLKAKNVTDIKAELHWKPYAANVRGVEYEISYGKDKKATSLGHTKTRRLVLALQDLKPDTWYYAKIRASNPEQTGPWSRVLAFLTVPYSPGEVPTSLEAKTEEKTQVSLTWSKVSGCDKYELAYSLDQGMDNKKIIKVSDHKALVTLEPNTFYYFQVRSVFAGRASYWSNLAWALTRPAVPKGLAISGQTKDQISIRWSAEKGQPDIAQIYQVRWQAESSSDAASTTYTAHTEYNFNDLDPDKVYKVTVRTLNDEFTSAWSSPLLLRPMSKFKANIRISQITTTGARVDWNSYPNSQYYELSYGTDVEAENKALLETRSTTRVLKDLTSGYIYYVKVHALLQDDTYGPWSAIATFKTYARPPRPANLSTVEITARSMEISWDKLPRVGKYEVKLQSKEADILRSFTRPPIRWDGLKPNTSYSVQARACNQGGSGPWSAPLGFITPLNQMPRNIRSGQVFSNRAVISWDALESDTDIHYQVRYAPKGEEWILGPKVSAPGVNLAGLLNNTEYKVQICVGNNSGLGPWSPSMSIHTTIAPPEKYPAGLKAKSIKLISATLCWAPLPGITEYRLGFGTTIDAEEEIFVIKDKTEYEITKLMPNTTYFVKVQAYNAAGEGPWTHYLELKTLPPPPMTPPTGTMIVDVTHNSLRLVWSSSLKAVRYDVSIGTNAQADNLGPPISVNDPPHTFVGLKPNMTYYLKARNVNRGGGGPWCSILRATTEEE